MDFAPPLSDSLIPKLLAVKLAGTSVLVVIARIIDHGGMPVLDLAMAVSLAAACGLVFLAKARRAGLTLLATASFWLVVRDLPFTLNHRALELLVLWLLVLAPATVQAEQRHLTMLHHLVLSVWVGAAVQKAVRGMFLSGETFALEVVSGRGLMASSLRMASFSDPQSVGCCIEGVVDQSVVWTPWLARTVVAMEAIIPAAVYVPRLRAFAGPGLVLLGLGFTVLTGEFDFGLTLLCLAPLFLAVQARPYLIPAFIVLATLQAIDVLGASR